MQANGKTRSSELQSLLDKIDKTRKLIAGQPGDSEFRNKVNEKIPGVVVIGPQSAGKSSLLSRLSGIEFPTSDKLCTRLPTVLKLRQGSEERTSVTLLGPNLFEQVFNSGDCATDIAAAQNLAVEHSNSVFPDGYNVEIYREGPSLVSFTITDLPGFISPKTDEEEISRKYIEALGTRYAEMHSNLVIHVMGVTEDYGVVLTKRLVHSLNPAKVITVLTKLDDLKMSKDFKRATIILEDFLQNTEGPRFVVQGNFKGSADEEEKALYDLGFFDSRMQLGSNALASYLEERIRLHIIESLPELKKTLVDELEKVRSWIDKNRECPSSEIVSKLVMEMVRLWPQKEQERKVRLLIQDMRSKIRGLRLQSSHSKSKSDHWKAATADDLEEGAPIMLLVQDEVGVGVDSNQEQAKETRQVFTTVKSRGHSEQVQAANGMVVDVAQLQVFDTEKSLLADVLNMIDETRGLVNEPFISRQEIAEAYLSNFSVRCGEVIQETILSANRITSETIERLRSETSQFPGASSAKRRIFDEIYKNLADLTKSGQRCGKRMVRYNEPPLVYTTNDHYLVQNIRNNTDHEHQKSAVSSAFTDRKSAEKTELGLIGKEPTQVLLRTLGSAQPWKPNDADAARDQAIKIIHDIEALWKVQVKFITELAAKEIGLIFIAEISERLSEIASTAQQFAVLVKEPEATVREREIKKNNLKILEQALELLSS